MTMTRSEAMKLMTELRSKLERATDEEPVTKEDVFAALYDPEHPLYRMGE